MWYFCRPLKGLWYRCTHNILQAKLEHYEIFGVASDWFTSYLWKEDICLYKLLGPILFSISMNDLNHTLKYCKVHHFADDANLHVNNSIKKLNALGNHKTSICWGKCQQNFSKCTEDWISDKKNLTWETPSYTKY